MFETFSWLLRKGWKFFKLVLGSFFAFIALTSPFITDDDYINSRNRLDIDGQIVAGKVLSKSRPSNEAYSVDYEFRTASGESVKDTASLTSKQFAELQQDAAVTVIYQAAFPGIHRLKDYSTPLPPLEPLPMRSISLILAILGIFIWWRNWPSSKQSYYAPAVEINRVQRQFRSQDLDASGTVDEPALDGAASLVRKPSFGQR